MGEVDDPFKNYFEFWNTAVDTRNKNILLHFPKLIKAQNMMAGQQRFLEQKYLKTCQLKFVSIAKKRILIVL